MQVCAYAGLRLNWVRRAGPLACLDQCSAMRDAHGLTRDLCRFPTPPQINVANVDPEKGTYAVGDFKTVALAGYIRAKVRLVALHVWQLLRRH